MSVFAEGLSDPRWMAVAPNGDVFVVESRKHQITVLMDSNGSKRADKKWVYARKLYYPFGIQIRGGYVWAANTGSVVRWKYVAGDTTSPGQPENVITGIPEAGYNQHWTRNILFSQSGKKLYLTVGSKANLAEESLPVPALWSTTLTVAAEEL
jgi:glucose/arabinose dehydrogenase